MDRLESHRLFFAQWITAAAGVPARGGRLEAALGSTPRERFLGPGPWRAFSPVGYITTPTDDPAFVYQDFAIALSAEATINNGQPALHALCLTALGVRDGETAVHVGAGTGYYTAVLARLVGADGRVIAYEIDAELAARAEKCLEDSPNVTVERRSGSAGALPACDIVYVNAGATAPAFT